MPRIVERRDYDGAPEKIARLGLPPLWGELEQILTGFELLISEQKLANGGAAIRAMIDERFKAAGGWVQKQTGDVDWTKCIQLNGGRACLSVEIQFSARSDMVIRDVVHLRDAIKSGVSDVGVIVVPGDRLAKFLMSRAPDVRTTVRTIDDMNAKDLPLVVLALEHDGVGAALEKRITSKGTGKKGKLGQRRSN